MKSDVAFSDKDDFNQLGDITMASWAQSHDYVNIQKAVEGDFEG